jgi:hypothetical protein
MALSKGQRVTLLTISDGMALTQRHELEVRAVTDPQAVGYQGRKTRVAVVRQRGRRKDVYLDVGADDILLDGWHVPFRTDMEAGGVFSGNACYNLVGDPDVIRQYVEGRAVLPVSDAARAKILVARGRRTTCDDAGLELLYPEIETHHAVVNRVKAARAG